MDFVEVCEEKIVELTEKLRSSLKRTYILCIFGFFWSLFFAGFHLWLLLKGKNLFSQIYFYLFLFLMGVFLRNFFEARENKKNFNKQIKMMEDLRDIFKESKSPE